MCQTAFNRKPELLYKQNDIIINMNKNELIYNF